MPCILLVHAFISYKKNTQPIHIFIFHRHCSKIMFCSQSGDAITDTGAHTHTHKHCQVQTQTHTSTNTYILKERRDIQTSRHINRQMHMHAYKLFINREGNKKTRGKLQTHYLQKGQTKLK